MRFRIPLPLALALLITGVNALKPAVVDDSAYLALAGNIAQHPTDPYGGTLFWYAEPQPAMEILAPIVLPAWLALGMKLLGGHLVLLKLWLFPFHVLLAYSVFRLSKTFVPRIHTWLSLLILFSPFVLPLMNVMLDIPALALGLSAVCVFIHSKNRTHLLIAGVLAGLAMQTKYTAFATPMVIVLYGITHGQRRRAVLVAGMAAAIFWVWELVLLAKYGQSHFLYHAIGPGASDLPFASKISMAQAHLKYAGGLGIGMAILALGAMRNCPWVNTFMVCLCALAICTVCLTPYSQTILLYKPNGMVGVDLSGVVFLAFGLVWLGAIIASMVKLTRHGASATTRFLIGWLVVEGVLALALSPFPAARRVIGLEFPATLLLFRAAEVWSRATRTPYPIPAFVFALTLGFGLFALDCWDAQAESQLPRQAGEVLKSFNPKSVYYYGHWGYQYACEQEGMKPLVYGKTILHSDDFLVVPEYPSPEGFYRPYHSGARPRWEKDNVELVQQLVWQDRLPASTVPTLYGGMVPILGRDHPRLVIGVYRVTREWNVIRQP